MEQRDIRITRPFATLLGHLMINDLVSLRTRAPPMCFRGRHRCDELVDLEFDQDGDLILSLILVDSYVGRTN